MSAGWLVIDVNIHFPFHLAAAAVLLGIAILSTGHKPLADAGRVQAEAVTPAAAAAVPAGTACG